MNFDPFYTYDQQRILSVKEFYADNQNVTQS